MAGNVLPNEDIDRAISTSSSTPKTDVMAYRCLNDDDWTISLPKILACDGSLCMAGRHAAGCLEEIFVRVRNKVK
jgi:hypothetical protein